jgi:hypothetical protein
MLLTAKGHIAAVSLEAKFTFSSYVERHLETKQAGEKSSPPEV